MPGLPSLHPSPPHLYPQGELESADATTAVLEDQLDTAIRSGKWGAAVELIAVLLHPMAVFLLHLLEVPPTSCSPSAPPRHPPCTATGDVSVLSGFKDSIAKGRNSLSKRMFKRGGAKAGASPSKDTLKHTVHVSEYSKGGDGWSVYGLSVSVSIVYE